MPLEATVIILDNSDFALDGDYQPTRYVAQSDAANIVFNIKSNSNPESVVGLMTMAGSSPQVLVTPTQDGGKVAAALSTVKMHGEADLHTGIQIAQLALKHRLNKNQRQRIIAFVASPLSAKSCSRDALVKLGKKMKKNNVAVDIVSLGEIEDNQEALAALVDAVNSSDNSHMLTVPPSTEILLSDVILSSSILAEDVGASGMGSTGPSGEGGSGEAGEFGVDPNLDPELAMALRMSLEDERARQAAQEAARAPPAVVPEEGSIAANASAGPISDRSPKADMALDEGTLAPIRQTPAAPVAQTSTAVGHSTAAQPEARAMGDVGPMEVDDEDAELARALALSRGDDVDMGVNDAGEVDDEEEEIRKAIALSLQAEQDDTSTGTEKK